MVTENAKPQESAPKCHCCQGRPRSGFVRKHGKIVLITASYQIFAVGMNLAGGQSLPMDPGRGAAQSGIVPSETSPDFKGVPTVLENPDFVKVTHAGFTLPCGDACHCGCLSCVGSNSCSCTGCVGCQGCKGCTGGCQDSCIDACTAACISATAHLHQDFWGTWKCDDGFYWNTSTKCALPWPEWTPHPTYKNVVWSGEGNSFHPALGYCWVSDPPGKENFRVKPMPEGTPHPTYPNVVWSDEAGKFRPADGYCWVSDPPSKSNFAVKPMPDGVPHPKYPNVVWSGEAGTFHPAYGYCWVSDPPGKDNFAVKPWPEGTPHPKYPNVVWSGEACVMKPAPGYCWVSDPPSKDGFSVKPMSEGAAHEKLPHVVWTGDGVHIRPAKGYDWVDTNNPNAGVKLQPNLIVRADGKLHAAPGFDWVDPADSNNLDVKLKPGFALSADGKLEAAPGYEWVNPADVEFGVKLKPGLALDADGKIQAAPGCRFVSNDPFGTGNFAVKSTLVDDLRDSLNSPNPSAPGPAGPAAAATGTDTKATDQLQFLNSAGAAYVQPGVDTGGAAVASSIKFPVLGTDHHEFKVPEKYLGDKEIQAWTKVKDKALEDRAKLDAQLKALDEERAKKVAAHEDTGELDVKKVDLATQRDAARSRAYTADVGMQDRVRKLQFHEDLPQGDETPSKGKDAPPAGKEPPPPAKVEEVPAGSLNFMK